MTGLYSISVYIISPAQQYSEGCESVISLFPSLISLCQSLFICKLKILCLCLDGESHVSF